MTKPRTDKPARKRPTREQLDERLSIPPGPKRTIKAILKPEAESQPVDPAARQRARDRAGD